MSLTLITGPANAAKAGAVLERLRAALPREPVARRPDRRRRGHYSRELAGAGIVFGAQVTTFSGLMRDIARAAGTALPRAGSAAWPATRVVRAVVADADLDSLAASGRAPGFADALAELFAELQRSLVAPARFVSAVRAWRAAGTAPAHADELARSTPPTTGGWRRWAPSTPTGSPSPRWTRSAPTPPPGAAGRSSSTASTS